MIQTTPHPYTDYPNITESGDFYTDHVLKEINGGIGDSVNKDNGEEFPTPMSTAIGESFIRFNVEDLLPRIAPRAVFVGHGYYNELHQRVEAEEAYRFFNNNIFNQRMIKRVIPISYTP